MSCKDCPTGQYKDNDADHTACQTCNDQDGKVVTKSKTKCELCPSVSIYLPATYPPLTNLIGGLNTVSF